MNTLSQRVCSLSIAQCQILTSHRIGSAHRSVKFYARANCASVVDCYTFFRRHSSHARDTFERFLGAVRSPGSAAKSGPASFMPRGTVRGETGCLMSWLLCPGEIPIIGDIMGGRPLGWLRSGDENCICPG